MLGPFAFLKLGPVGGAREAFAVGGVEAEGDGEAAFAERRVCFERKAFLQGKRGKRGQGETGSVCKNLTNASPLSSLPQRGSGS